MISLYPFHLKVMDKNITFTFLFYASSIFAYQVVQDETIHKVITENRIVDWNLYWIQNIKICLSFTIIYSISPDTKLFYLKVKIS
jgi:hypothetical protein